MLVLYVVAIFSVNLPEYSAYFWCFGPIITIKSSEFLRIIIRQLEVYFRVYQVNSWVLCFLFSDL
jgi:hypothetical protein